MMILNQDLQISLCDVGITDQTKFTMQKKMLAYYKKALYTTGASAKALYKLCIDSLYKSVVILDTSIKNNDSQDLYLALHNLKSTLGSTGLQELMEDARILSTYAKALTKGEIDTFSLGFLEAIEKFKTKLLFLCEEQSDDSFG